MTFIPHLRYYSILLSFIILSFIFPVSAQSFGFNGVFDWTMLSQNAKSGGTAINPFDGTHYYFFDQYPAHAHVLNDAVNNYWSIDLKYDSIDASGLYYYYETERYIRIASGGYISTTSGSVTVPILASGQWVRFVIDDTGVNEIQTIYYSNGTIYNTQTLTKPPHTYGSYLDLSMGTANISFDNIIASSTVSGTILNEIVISPLDSGAVCYQVNSELSSCTYENTSFFAKIGDLITLRSKLSVWDSAAGWGFDNWNYYSETNGIGYSKEIEYSYFITDTSTNFITANYKILNYSTYTIYINGSGSVRYSYDGTTYMGAVPYNFTVSVINGDLFELEAVPISGQSFLNYLINGTYYYSNHIILRKGNTNENITVSFTDVLPNQTPIPIPTYSTPEIDNISSIGTQVNSSLGDIHNITGSSISNINDYNYSTSKSIFTSFLPSILNMIPVKIWGLIILGWSMEIILIILRR